MALDVFSSVRNLFKPEDLTIDNFVFQVLDIQNTDTHTRIYRIAHSEG